MMEQSTARLREKLTALGTGVLTALIGGGHLAAWLAGVMAQRGVSAVTMKTNTAFCLLLLGLGLVLMAVNNGAARRRAGRACAALALLIGALTLSENLIGWDLGIDQLLATEPPGALGMVSPNRMGTPASICVVLSGVALLLLSDRRVWMVWAAQAMALGVCLIALLGNIGHLYGVRELYGVARVTTIAWPTALALLLLGGGLLCARAREGLMAQVTAADPGGAILRRLLLPALLLPVALGWLRLTGERMGYYETAMGTALLMLTFITALSALAWFAGRWVSRSDAVLRENEERYRAFVEASAQVVWTTNAAGEVAMDIPAWQAYTGQSAEEARGLGWMNAIHADDRAQVAEAWHKAVRARGLYEVEYLLRRHDDSWRNILARGVPVLDKGVIREYIGTCIDITERKQAEEALREHREWLRVTLASIGDGVMSCDLAGRITFLNPVAEGLTGWKNGEAQGEPIQSVFKIINEKTRQGAEDIVARVLREGHVMELANPTALLARDGREIPIEDSAAPIRDEAGNVAGVVLVFHDVTEKRREEAELHKLNRTLRALSNTNQALIHAADETALLQEVCRIITQDCGFEMMWVGYAEEDEAKTVRPVAHAGFEEGYLETLRITWSDTERGRGPTGTAIRTGKPRACRNMLTDPQFAPWREQALRRGYASSLVLPLLEDGRAFGAVSIYSREPDSFTPDEEKLLMELAGDLAYGIGAIRMREARAKAEEEVRRQREWLRVTLTSIGDGVITCDTEGRVSFLNPVAEALSGWRLDAALGQPIRNVFKIINEQTRQSAADIVGRVLLEKRIIELANHTVLVTRDGREVPIEDSAAPILDRDGEMAGVVLVFHDVTQQRNAREALRKANEQLAEADKRKDEFLAMLAHELRNPLAPIRNAAQILKLAGANEQVREKNRELIDRQASHMGRLLDDLLEVSRVTRGKISLKLEPLDLRTIVQQAVEAASHAAQARRLELHYAHPPEPVWLEGDFTRLEQVVGNLINNAIKYSDEGRIQVSVGREPAHDGKGPSAVVRVRDTGIGISPEMLPRVFELFAQADQSLERQRGGLGIGLTMVKRLVDLHGGRVEARSAGLGQGSEFSVFLPLLEKDLPQETPAIPAPAPDSQEETPLKVLVVDDNQDGAGSLKDLLEMWGYVVRMAFDGQEAVQLACTFLPDVVLLDIGLPGMSGYAVARKLREERSLEMVKIIALTGYGQEEDRKMTRESGCDAHLVKPVDLHHLQTMLARIMAGA